MTGKVFSHYTDAGGRVLGMSMSEFRSMLQQLFLHLEGQARAEMNNSADDPGQPESGDVVCSREINFATLFKSCMNQKVGVAPLPRNDEYHKLFGDWAVQQMWKMG